MVDLFFAWVTPLVQRGHGQQQLHTDDLLALPPTVKPRTCTSDLWNQWSKTYARGRPSLLRAVAAAYGGPYYCLGVLKLLNDALTFAGAMLLNLLVRHLEQSTPTGTGNRVDNNSGPFPAWFPGPGSPYWGYVLAGVLGLSALLKAVIGSHYNYGLSLVTVRLRGGVMGVLFRSALLNRATDAAGDVNTLMAVDTGRLANLCVSFHELWSLPLQIAAAVWLLYVQVQTAFLAGVLLCVALIPVNRAIAQRIQAASVDLMASKDSRLALLSQLLSHMGVVKALGLEEVLRDKIQSFRSSELTALAKRKYLDALCVYFWAATQLLLSGTTFGLMVLLGQPLRPSVVFTCLALFNVLIAPLNAFPWVVNGVVEAVVSLRRIQAYLLLPQRCISWAYSDKMLPEVTEFQKQQQQQCSGPEVAPGLAGPGGFSGMMERGAAAQLINASFAWRKGQPPCLSQLHLAIPAGCLTAVVGEVGSGKSSLLAALLGELELTEGHVKLPHKPQHWRQQQQHVPRIGYVAQTPWLMAGSVRDNICLGQRYDAELMGEILHAVGLDQDLAAMPHADLTQVGDAGQKLSGGQRLRVALARALYQPGTDTYLFDDLLASLDGHVAQWVIRHTLFGGLLSGATVVVVTKHPLVIQSAQLVVGLEHGRQAYCGSAQGFAHWKALQAVQSSPHVDALPAATSWTPLVRHSSPGPRRLRFQQQQPHPLQQHDAQISQDSAAASDDMRPFTAPAHFSEDVAPSELLLAGGHGVWACHASLSPQLNAITDDESDSLEGASTTPGRRKSRSLGRTLSLEGADSLADSTGQESGAMAAAAAQVTRSGSSQHAGDKDNRRSCAVDAALHAAGQQQQQHVGDVVHGVPVTVWHGKEQQQQPEASTNRNSDTAAAHRTAAAAAVVTPPQDHGIDAPTVTDDNTAAAGSGGGGSNSGSEEARAVGAVKWTVYAAYARAVGLGMTAAVLISLMLMQATKNGIDLWVTHNLQHSTNSVPSTAAASAVTAGCTGVVACSDYSMAAPSFVINASGRFYTSGSAVASVVSAGGSPATAGAAGVTVLSYASAAGMWPDEFVNSSSSSSNVQLHDVLCCDTGAQQQQRGQEVQWHQQQQQLQSSRRLLRSKLLTPVVPHVPLDAPLAAAAAGRPVHQEPAPHMHSKEQQQGIHPQQQQQQHTSYISPPWPGFHWRPAPLDPQMAHFLRGLGVIAGLNTLATLARAFSFAAAGMSAAEGIHRRLLAAVLAAPMSFFDANPAGRILNRFSSDTSMVDDALPFILNILLANAVSLAGLLVVLLLGQPLLLLLLLPLGLTYRWLQLFYRSTARELRRLESQSLSPLYSLFGETVAGAATIRAAAAQKHFMKRFLGLMDPYQSACLNNAAASNWLGARLQLLAAVLLTAVAGLAAAVSAAAAAQGSKNASWGVGDCWSTEKVAAAAQYDSIGNQISLTVVSFAGSTGSATNTASSTIVPSACIGSTYSRTRSTFRIDLLGLALAYCLPIVQLLNGLLTSSAETEQEMVAVERIVAYLDDITPEEEEEEEQQQQQQQGRATAESAVAPPPAVRQRRQPRLYQRQQQLLLTAAGGVQQHLQEPLLPQQQQQQVVVLPVAAAAAAAEYAIAFVDVVMRYRPELPPALQGVNFSLKSGQKLGICGRTGAGKSSIVAALLRLRPIQSGFILVQGQDAKTQPLKTLRSQFGVVPQSPVLFCGTLRDNLDPRGTSSDQQVAAALQAVRMWAPLCEMALHRGVLSHGTYLLARRAGSDANLAAAASTADTPPPPPPAGGVIVGATDWLGQHHTDGALTPAALAEGAAAAIGAAAGVAAAAAAAADLDSLEAEIRLARFGAFSGDSKRSEARQQQPWQPRTGNSALKFPPVPMAPAQKLLAMQVGGTAGLQLSTGQSQLVCLARLLLRGAPLVLLDEATAAVDPHTATLMHQVLHEQLDVTDASSSSSSRRPTVLQIAHELAAIIDYDALVVMAGGKVVEHGNPRQLAAQQSSKFANLLAQAGHRMLQQQEQQQ